MNTLWLSEFEKFSRSSEHSKMIWPSLGSNFIKSCSLKRRVNFGWDLVRTEVKLKILTRKIAWLLVGLVVIIGELLVLMSTKSDFGAFVLRSFFGALKHRVLRI